jgi:phosphotransferase system IIB component
MCIYGILGTILRFIVSKEGKTLDPKKIEALVKMIMPKTPKDIQVFIGMAEFYRYFMRNFASVMALITKLFRKVEVFE